MFVWFVGVVKVTQPAMSREELERHLDQKQSKSALMSIEKTPLLPDNIFNENSNSWSVLWSAVSQYTVPIQFLNNVKPYSFIL